MPVSAEVRDAIREGSWIRKMFEEGARLKAEKGPDNVFDFSLGNPYGSPPDELLGEIRKLTTDPPPDLHRYMPNAGFPDVRKKVADSLARSTGLPFTADHVLMTTGAAGALNVALRAILSPGDAGRARRGARRTGGTDGNPRLRPVRRTVPEDRLPRVLLLPPGGLPAEHSHRPLPLEGPQRPRGEDRISRGEPARRGRRGGGGRLRVLQPGAGVRQRPLAHAKGRGRGPGPCAGPLRVPGEPGSPPCDSLGGRVRRRSPGGSLLSLSPVALAGRDGVRRGGPGGEHPGGPGARIRAERAFPHRLLRLPRHRREVSSLLGEARREVLPRAQAGSNPMKIPFRRAVARMEGDLPGEQPQERGFIKLNTNENPYPPSPAVRRAIRAEADASLRLYPDPESTRLRRQAALTYGFDLSRVIAGNGSDELLAMIARAFVGEGDTLCCPTPTYTLYDTVVRIQTSVS